MDRERHAYKLVETTRDKPYLSENLETTRRKYHIQ